MKKFQSDKSIDNTDKLNERVQELENEVSDKNNVRICLSLIIFQK